MNSLNRQLTIAAPIFLNRFPSLLTYHLNYIICHYAMAVAAIYNMIK